MTVLSKPAGTSLRGWLATAAGAAAVVAALVVLYTAYEPLMNDFEVYFYGGHRVLQTGETGVNELYAPRDGLPFTYPPFAAVVFYPLSLLPFGVVAFIWQLGIFAALYGVARTSL